MLNIELFLNLFLIIAQMKRLAIALCLLSLMAATCNGDKKAILRQKTAVSYFLTDTKIDSILWKLVQIYDPYSGSMKIPDEEAKYLSIQKDGKYVLYSPGNTQSGKWYLKKDKSALALVAEGSSTEDESLMFRHQIRKYAKDTMILAWQGRHGFVEELYVRAESIDYPSAKALP